MPKEIPLTQGKVALVSDEDFDYLGQSKWHAHFDGTNWYAMRNISVAKGQRAVLAMHRAILNPPSNLRVDHINHNGLDNRRENIRICTHPENMQNQRKIRGTSSKYKGTSWNKRIGKWQAYVQPNGVRLHLGYFSTEEEAAAAYDTAAIQYYGEFANLNLPRIVNEIVAVDEQVTTQ